MGFLAKMSPAATKVYPSSLFTSYSTKKQLHMSRESRSSSDNTTTKLTSMAESGGGDEVVLTVWKKSLLVNCNGFTVFDGKGNLVYRVDNYVTGNREEIILMNATGKPLLTIRRKKLRLSDSWMIYDGEKTTHSPKLCVRKNVNLLNSKTLAHVTAGTKSSAKKNIVYEMEGSYAKRCVSMYDSKRRCVAEIRGKEAPGGISLGADVFSLHVSRPYTDSVTAMGFVILLEQMFGSSSSSLPRLYSP